MNIIVIQIINRDTHIFGSHTGIIEDYPVQVKLRFTLYSQQGSNIPLIFLYDYNIHCLKTVIFLVSRGLLHAAGACCEIRIVLYSVHNIVRHGNFVYECFVCLSAGHITLKKQYVARWHTLSGHIKVNAIQRRTFYVYVAYAVQQLHGISATRHLLVEKNKILEARACGPCFCIWQYNNYEKRYYQECHQRHREIARHAIDVCPCHITTYFFGKKKKKKPRRYLPEPRFSKTQELSM